VPQEGDNYCYVFKLNMSNYLPKNSAIHRLGVLHEPGIILIQETISNSSNVVDILRKILKNWECLYEDSDDSSGGLINTWNKNLS